METVEEVDERNQEIVKRSEIVHLSHHYHYRHDHNDRQTYDQMKTIRAQEEYENPRMTEGKNICIKTIEQYDFKHR